MFRDKVIGTFCSRIVLTHVVFAASEKGDTTENCDPNSLIANGSSKPSINDQPIEKVEKSHIEAPTESAACTSESKEESDVCEIPEQVEFTVVFNKSKHDITFAYDATVLELKAHLERICGVPQSAQKLIIKGMARDNVSLRQAGVVKGGKVMLVGSKMDDILAMKSAPKVCMYSVVVKYLKIQIFKSVKLNFVYMLFRYIKS